MGCLTANRPKCLISMGGRPILYSVAEAFGNENRVVIIGDYKVDTLKLYLENFPPPFDYEVVIANGKGTCSGIQKAIDIVDGEGFALVWSDLYFSSRINLSGILTNSIGLSKETICRWSYVDKKLMEVPNNLPNLNGVIGVFFFPEPGKLPHVPEDGEFVKFLSDEKVELAPLMLTGIKEVGTMDEFNKQRDAMTNSRFFNEVIINKDKVIKKSRDRRYDPLIFDEINWYRFVNGRGFKDIPKLLSSSPLTLARVAGRHPFEYSGSDHNMEMKAKIVRDILEKLDELHKIDHVPFDQDIAKEVYIKKTVDRISAVSNVIPYKDSETLIINGEKVPNLLHSENGYYINDLFSVILRNVHTDHFELIHGDPTFSNIILESDTNSPVFIDPRGYFGSLKLFGDPMYDYSKLYYSAVGNYDFFNRGRFCLSLDRAEIKVKIDSEGFEFTEKIFDEMFGERIRAIKAIHALIWLSLSGYVTDDYDAILASYFNGLRLSKEVLDEYA